MSVKRQTQKAAAAGVAIATSGLDKGEYGDIVYHGGAALAAWLDQECPTAAASLGNNDAHLFSVKDPWLYVEGDLWDGREKGSMGAEFFTAPNPPFGAVFSYYLRDGFETMAKERRKREIELEKDGEDTPYPSWETLRAEDLEEAPAAIFIIRDADGNIVRQLMAETDPGLHRSAWDLRYPATDPVSLETPDFIPYWASAPRGPLVVPGEYSVTLAARQRGRVTELDGPRTFTVKSLPQSPETSADPEAVRAFQRKAGDLHRAVQGAVAHVAEMENRVAHVKSGIADTPGATEADAQAARELTARLADINVVLNGDSTVSSRNEAVPWSVARRAGTVYQWLLDTRSPVPGFYEDSYRVAADEFATLCQPVELGCAPHSPRVLWTSSRPGS